MLKRFRWFRGRGLLRNKKGFTLIEVVIAIMVLGLVVASVPLAVMAIYNAQFKQNEQRIAENIARYEFEYIKSQDYIPGNSSLFIPPSPYDDGNPLRGSYYAKNYVYFVDPETHESYADPLKESGIQEIVIWVYGIRGEDYAPLYKTSNYKVLR